VILGVSHMTLGCADTDQAVAALAPLGYAAEFVERGITNMRFKAPYLSRAYTKHDIAFMRAAHGLPLELIRYAGAAQSGRGAFCGYFAQPAVEGACRPTTAALTTPMSFQQAGASSLAELCELVGFNAAAVFDPAPEAAGGLTMAGLVTADIEASQRFWCDGLGYKVIDEGGAWSKISFLSPVPDWNFTVLLQQNEPPHTLTMLDSVGMTCCSHLCSALTRDRDRLLNAGATEASGAFPMTVNKKVLTVEFFRGPSGELIELLQIGA
jgi:hypothetical protein